MNLKDKNIYSHAMLIEFKGHPLNTFSVEIYNSKGDLFDRYFMCNERNAHRAYSIGFDKLKEAMIAEGRSDCLNYTGTLREFANRKYFKNPIKRKLYAFYLWIGRAFKENGIK